jgi:hypothetical protein
LFDDKQDPKEAFKEFWAMNVCVNLGLLHAIAAGRNHSQNRKQSIDFNASQASILVDKNSKQLL